MLGCNLVLLTLGLTTSSFYLLGYTLQLPEALLVVGLVVGEVLDVLSLFSSFAGAHFLAPPQTVLGENSAPIPFSY